MLHNLVLETAVTFNHITITKITVLSPSVPIQAWFSETLIPNWLDILSNEVIINLYTNLQDNKYLSSRYITYLKTLSENIMLWLVFNLYFNDNTFFNNQIIKLILKVKFPSTLGQDL